LFDYLTEQDYCQLLKVLHQQRPEQVQQHRYALWYSLPERRQIALLSNLDPAILHSLVVNCDELKTISSQLSRSRCSNEQLVSEAPKILRAILSQFNHEQLQRVIRDFDVPSLGLLIPNFTALRPVLTAISAQSADQADDWADIFINKKLISCVTSNAHMDELLRYLPITDHVKLISSAPGLSFMKDVASPSAQQLESILGPIVNGYGADLLGEKILYFPPRIINSHYYQLYLRAYSQCLFNQPAELFQEAISAEQRLETLRELGSIIELIFDHTSDFPRPDQSMLRNIYEQFSREQHLRLLNQQPNWVRIVGQTWYWQRYIVDDLFAQLQPEVVEKFEISRDKIQSLGGFCATLQRLGGGSRQHCSSSVHNNIAVILSKLSKMKPDLLMAYAPQCNMPTLLAELDPSVGQQLINTIKHCHEGCTKHFDQCYPLYEDEKWHFRSRSDEEVVKWRYGWERFFYALEVGLTLAAAIPGIGSLFGLSKILLGLCQMALTQFQFAFPILGSSVIPEEHFSHGLGNIIRGMLEAVPLLGTISCLSHLWWLGQAYLTYYQAQKNGQCYLDQGQYGLFWGYTEKARIEQEYYTAASTVTNQGESAEQNQSANEAHQQGVPVAPTPWYWLAPKPWRSL
jgi:hypothetical protein